MIAQPAILKYVHPRPSGIRITDLKRHCIGMILCGRGRIHRGDTCHELRPGDIFYLPPGVHALEDLPEMSRAAEQIACYFTAPQLCQIITDIQAINQIVIPSEHAELSDSHIACSADEAVKAFFTSLSGYLGESGIQGDRVIEQLKLTELIYLLLCRAECPIAVRLRAITAHGKDDFEYIIRSNILSELSIEELAALCNRSLSSFKKDFRALFRQPPHRWLTSQRLLRARTLLRSTDMPIARVASACRFSTPSHFIKQFKKAYGITPAVYRRSNS